MQQSSVINKSSAIIATSMAIGLPSLILIEGENISAERAKAMSLLSDEGFIVAGDYSEVMDSLAKGVEKIMYSEKGEKLDALVLEIVAEYSAGIVSLADRKNNTGLKIAKFDPFKICFAVLMTRLQSEASYPRLYEYCGSVTSSATLL